MAASEGVQNSESATGAASWRAHLIRIFSACVNLDSLQSAPSSQALRVALLRELQLAFKMAGKALPRDDKGFLAIRHELASWAKAVCEAPAPVDMNDLLIASALLDVDHLFVTQSLQALLTKLCGVDMADADVARACDHLLVRLLDVFSELRDLPSLLVALLRTSLSSDGEGGMDLLTRPHCQQKLQAVFTTLPGGQVDELWAIASLRHDELLPMKRETFRSCQSAVLVPLCKTAVLALQFDISPAQVQALSSLLQDVNTRSTRCGYVIADVLCRSCAPATRRVPTTCAACVRPPLRSAV